MRPLFRAYPLVGDIRFETCLQKLKKEIRLQLRSYQLSRSNASELHWYQFNPSVKYIPYKLELILNRKSFKGDFGLVTFVFKEKRFILLPSFKNFLFIAEHEEMSEGMIINAAVEKSIKLAKKWFKESEGEIEDEIDTNAKKEFLHSMKFDVRIGKTPFQFEQVRQDWFFAASQGAETFDGAFEIEKVGNDLNEKYPNQLKKAFFREDYVENIYNLLYKKQNVSFALIGKIGSGRHTLIESAISQYLESFKTLDFHKAQKIWRLDPNRVISGMSVVGWWQKRFEAILDFIRSRQGKNGLPDHLLIDNPISLLRIGQSSQNKLTLSDVLKPYIEKRNIQTILIATQEEWKTVQEKDRRFADLFQVFRLSEPNYEIAFRMAIAYRRYLENLEKCEIAIKAINQLFYFHRNYLKKEALPGGVINIMNQLAAKYRGRMISDAEVIDEFEFISGLQPVVFDQAITFEEGAVESALKQQLIGQPKAIEALANGIHTIKAKLNDPSKPLYSFMFIGPTGVGKTQAAKALNNYLLEREDDLIRFDMNEYIDWTATNRLIGDEGNPEGLLTSRVRFRPFSVILLDEIEKAHSSVLDLLLQVLDDGRLTDSLGRTTDFSNTIIIMTSNVGAKQASNQMGFQLNKQDDQAIYRKSIENYFRPEFINRIDKIVVFSPLQLEDIYNIARMQIRDLLKRDGFVRRTTMLNISEEALKWVARRGFDARMGGRALKRQIERDLTSLSADQLLNKLDDNPIILDVVIKNESLFPKISELNFVNPLEDNWLPKLPPPEKGGHFYQKLIHRIESLEAKLENSLGSRRQEEDSVIVFDDQNKPSLNYEYYGIKELINETKEKLVNLKLGYRSHYFRENPASPLRLKGAYTSSIVWKTDNASKGYRNVLKDRLFQQEGIIELRENYFYGSPEFDSLKTEYLESFLTVAFIQLFVEHLVQFNGNNEVQLAVRSCITGRGKEEVQYLSKLYQQLLNTLDLDFDFDKNNHTFSFQENAYSALFRGEQGIHLFYPNQEPPLPIQVSINKKDDNTKGSLSIVRLYDSERTITDIRTNFSNSYDINIAELQLLIFAGFEKRFRKLEKG